MRWLALLLLLSGCATGHRWYWKPAAEIGGGATRDVLLWSLPETEADLAFDCDADALRIILVGVEQAMAEPVRLTASSVVFQGRLVPDPPDGLEAATIQVPLDHPLVAAIADGARSIRFDWQDSHGRIPLGRIPSRFVQACIEPEDRK